jgi:predicted RNA binding protein YcfA (HicA-like mRNA interferase family)
MSKLVPVNHRVLFRILKKLDFECVRQRGGHTIWEHPDGRVTVVPVHGREEIRKGLLSKILDDIKITVEEFNKLR